ncbi:Sulfhydryl oxidase 1 [Lamellibrachia satsuma]|nr:Sulfhydryl oxidase 1 [Lamellibrachia satsuma]
MQDYCYVSCIVLFMEYSKFNPKEVPLLINDYIQQFFGCRECAVNFGKGAGTISCDVTRRSDAILWLWRSHNRANHWLHKDPTEDPQQAKIQFPSYRVCALCRRARSYDLFDTKIVWDETNVLQYLKRFYAKARIKQSAKDDAANDSSTGCGYDISVKIVLVVSILFAMCGSWSGHNL